ncbi:MAG: hypothetical protein EA352_04810 [Gemmatimonadales bacterium]|nr:MAG: hypothetical protein EA352_04810 [Gemmatimonadales bacterium]
MNDMLRRRILRRLETLPEEQLYQVLDYIEFLESRYNRGGVSDASGLQRLAERLEDGLRKRTVNPSNLREAFQVISAADRVLSSVSTAGRQILDELQVGPEPGEGRPSGDHGGGRPPAGRGEGPLPGVGGSRPAPQDPPRDPRDPRDPVKGPSATGGAGAEPPVDTSGDAG